MRARISPTKTKTNFVWKNQQTKKKNNTGHRKKKCLKSSRYSTAFLRFSDAFSSACLVCLACLAWFVWLSIRFDAIRFVPTRLGSRFGLFCCWVVRCFIRCFLKNIENHRCLQTSMFLHLLRSYGNELTTTTPNTT